MDLKLLCSGVCELAGRIGKQIKADRDANRLQIEAKGSNDFVTHYDKLSEQLLVEGLRELLPSAGFIAEEGTAGSAAETHKWIVDPIDGTTNFIHGLDPFALSVALEVAGEIVLGVVYEAGRDECFYAWKGGGAYLNGMQICVSKAKRVADSLIATGFPYSNFLRLDRFMTSLRYFMQHSHGLRRLGSAATDLAYVACGRFDAFYEYDLKPYDVAAGALIVKEAGGKVSDFNLGDNYIYGREIVASNNEVFDEFATQVKKMMID